MIFQDSNCGFFFNNRYGRLIDWIQVEFSFRLTSISVLKLLFLSFICIVTLIKIKPIYMGEPYSIKDKVQTAGKRIITLST